MKKLVLILVVIFIIILLIPEENKELRIRIIANSDSRFDQDIKLMVAEDMKEFLKNNQDVNIIEKRVEYLISKYNVGYSVKVEMRKEKFPAKTLNDDVIPGGSYKALVIELGKAEGKNYWSLLYPEYFNVSFEDLNSQDVEYRSWFIDLIRGDLK